MSSDFETIYENWLHRHPYQTELDWKEGDTGTDPEELGDSADLLESGTRVHGLSVSSS